MKRRVSKWPQALRTTRLHTSDDNLCTAYFRRAAGEELLTDSVVRCDEHMLVVVDSGALVLESTQCPIAVHTGDSALVAAGNVRVTEAPLPGCETSYWLIFFGPKLLRAAIGEGPLAENLARQTAPVFSGVYPQRRTLTTLRAHQLSTPVCDVKATFMVMMATMSASVLMFLQNHFYFHRALLQELARHGCAETARFPGGTKTFRKLFNAYHGVNVHEWRKRQKKSQPSIQMQSGKVDCTLSRKPNAELVHCSGATP